MNMKIKISIHPITKKYLPCYHAGVDDQKVIIDFVKFFFF